ncbi:Zn(II)2Cys6 transcription factor [Talaromyces proteolyticus]|uniref:Zn(II)2Cys6 transcription factor n=1 Tax=Talaromyces proteolyticus TaxID=1131652 RepID=A0AAD4Q2D4_9EURO|nr:Zn(II)2Cys6 transcription factor [Talaromyces proteolyticus]KAH8700208.1 Zn(II)2Cys6 transcription factor [Talaromyces proteolyticus]
MNASHRESRIRKRSSNACQRCRKQKIKCSGIQPCNTCHKRKLTCTFDDRDQKILVTRGFIEDLQARISSLERDEDETSSLHSYIEQDRARSNHENIPLIENRLDPNLEEESDLTNPLSTAPSTFMTAANGRTFYLGTSSNWSFARRILSMTHEHVYNSPLPTESLLFEGSTYDLGWDGLRTTVDQELPIVPTLDYSIYLINAVKFHAGQLFHLFDEGTFMGGLYAFYEDPQQQMASPDLWYIHYLVIIALGKALVVHRNRTGRPPGCEFFTKALQLLPDSTHLCRDPVNATEILCCIALYLQSLDFRSAAHNFIGQAVRIALAQGMHTDMPVQHLGDALVQRCRSTWWTIYILDRLMTSLMGLPQSIHDSQIHDQLPYFPGSPQKAIALSMQIRMCQIIAEINSTVYGADGRLNQKFLVRTKKALASTTNLASDLQRSFDLQLDKSTISGVSRLSAHLHLLYHQCIVLATRPLLLCFLTMKFQSADICLETLDSLANVLRLLQVCIDSAQQQLNILTCLYEQSLLDSFLPFDLEATFVSSIVLLIAPKIDISLLENRTAWLQKSYVILDDMISRGNLIARFRKSELEQLGRLLDMLSPDGPFQPDDSMEKGQQDGVETPMSSLMHHTYRVTELLSLNDGLTTAEIMAVAESIDTGDVDWVAHAVTENQIW